MKIKLQRDLVGSFCLFLRQLKWHPHCEVYLYIFVMTLSPFFRVVYISNPLRTTVPFPLFLIQIAYKKHEYQVVQRFDWGVLSLTETTRVASALRSILYLYIFVMTLSPFSRAVYISNPIKWRKKSWVVLFRGGGRKVT
jgi:hypothetical protein